MSLKAVKNEIIIYQSDDLSTKIEVRIEEDTIWLTQAQIVNLFNSSKANINEHVKNIFQSGELEMQLTVRKIRTVQIEGKRTVSREILHYNLDMIISIGYRVNSIRGTQFRIWANKVLKDYLLKGYALNQRISRIENDVHYLKEKANEFLIIDNTKVFHIGASLKDLGKKWFAFSKINFDTDELIKKLNADM